MRIYKDSRFPNIDRWLNENRLTRKELARRMNVPCSTLYNVLMKKHDPGLCNIKALLRVTGMTFEEAFREEEP